MEQRRFDLTQREVPAKSYPLGQAAKAHERLGKHHVLGKIVLGVHDR